MDLSFSRFEHDAPLTILPPDLAVLMVGIAARQAASPTALQSHCIVASIDNEDVFAPPHGAFNAPVAEALRRWREMKTVFTEPL